jgi:hypothetical protein
MFKGTYGGFYDLELDGWDGWISDSVDDDATMANLDLIKYLQNFTLNLESRLYVRLHPHLTRFPLIIR